MNVALCVISILKLTFFERLKPRTLLPRLDFIIINQGLSARILSKVTDGM